MRITFIIPSRNNIAYLKQAVKSIQDCYGDAHDLVLLDDASTDGTWDWIQQLEGSNIIKYRNESPDRVGHTVLYDMGVKLSNTEVFTILHADMVITPDYIPNLIKHVEKGVVVSGTRIEPPLHPPGPEKIVKHLGFEPSEFSYDALLEFVGPLQKEYRSMVTEGIFAPWMMYKEDFIGIGGHDLLFAPMELEDSDIFNRMLLAGLKFVQARDAFVYHMTCRGSRFKDGLEIEREISLPDGTIWYKPKDSEEYLKLRNNKFREWWRKWHCNVLHDDFMKPIVPPRYETAFVVRNCNLSLLEILEPWCDRIYVDERFEVGRMWDYVEVEGSETMFDLTKRVLVTQHNDPQGENDIIIEFDSRQLTQDYYENFIQKIPFILSQVKETGTFEYGIFRITIHRFNKMNMVQPFFKNVF